MHIVGTIVAKIIAIRVINICIINYVIELNAILQTSTFKMPFHRGTEQTGSIDFLNIIIHIPRNHVEMKICGIFINRPPVILALNQVTVGISTKNRGGIYSNIRGFTSHDNNGLDGSYAFCGIKGTFVQRR